MSENALVGAVVVTHGRLCEEMVAAARMIVGEIPHITSVSIGWHDAVEEAKSRIEKAIREVDRGRGVIILTDMFGGTPSNIALSFHSKDKCEVITGVNLPMVVKLASQSGERALSELVTIVRDQGQKQISVASQLLEE